MANATCPRTLVAALIAAALVLSAAPAHAWVYPEHRDIAVLAVAKLAAERKAQLDRLWGDARVGNEQRLCAQPADTQQGVAPECIDWAAFTAIAGDHSCSSSNMLDTTLKTEWILQVADVGAQLKIDLSQVVVAPRPDVQLFGPSALVDFQRQVEDEAQRARRINALRTSDTRLQRADPQYATRAGSNNAHFLLPRPTTDTTPREYAELSLKAGAPISAVGVYAWFHLSALQKASRLASESLDQAGGRAGAGLLPHTPGAPIEPDAFDVCKNNTLIRRDEGVRVTSESVTPLAQALRQTPVPGLGPGLGSMPRFRAEVGPFVGFAAAADVRAIDGGYLPSVTSAGGVAAGDLAVPAGFGLDGLISESADGLVFAQLGLRADSRSTNDVPVS